MTKLQLINFRMNTIYPYAPNFYQMQSHLAFYSAWLQFLMPN